MTTGKITKLIEKHQETIIDDVRDYIGASSIGSDCLRQIWYAYKGFESTGVPTKTRRTWDIGKRLEYLIFDWLELAGLQVVRTWWDLKSQNVPSFRGHLDCVWIKNGKEHAIIEVKTAKDSSFKAFVNKGLRLWNPQYYAQVQAYMGMSGIHSAYILVLNKDTSEIYDEFLTFDEKFYKELEDKALMISQSDIEPPRVNGSPLWYQCKLCKYNKECHK
jgi:hypothetical protein